MMISQSLPSTSRGGCQVFGLFILETKLCPYSVKHWDVLMVRKLTNSRYDLQGAKVAKQCSNLHQEMTKRVQDALQKMATWSLVYWQA